MVPDGEPVSSSAARWPRYRRRWATCTACAMPTMIASRSASTCTAAISAASTATSTTRRAGQALRVGLLQRHGAQSVGAPRRMNHAPASAAEPLLRIARQGPLTHLTLNRPARGNALSAALVAALAAAVEACHGTARACWPSKVPASTSAPASTRRTWSRKRRLAAGALRARRTAAAGRASAPFVTVALVEGRAMGASADWSPPARGAGPRRAAASPFRAGFGWCWVPSSWPRWSAPLARAAGSPAVARSAARTRCAPAQWTPWSCRRARSRPAALLEQACRTEASTQAAIHAAAGRQRRRRSTRGPACRHGALRRAPGLKDRIAAYRAATRR